MCRKSSYDSRKSDEKSKRNDELATAILKDKPKPNRLIAEQSPKDDNSVVLLSQVCSTVSNVNFLCFTFYSIRPRWMNWDFFAVILSL